MRATCCILAILALATPRHAIAQPPIVDRTVHVIFVEPAGETFTLEEQASAWLGIKHAIAYWEQLSPITTSLTLAEPQLITSTESMTGSLEWSRPYWADPADVTIFIIDSPWPLVGDAVGQSQTPMGIIWVLRTEGLDFEATVAHELGHVLYKLPHEYDARDLDIMGLAPVGAYMEPAIGCASLAQLGRPCASLFFPMVSS